MTSLNLDSIQDRFKDGEAERSSSACILVVEDSDEDFEALTRMMSKLAVTNQISRCIDGEEALDYLNQEGSFKNPVSAPPPSLVLLDLNLPGTDGRDVLKHIKTTEHLRRIPVIVLSTSSNPKDIQSCYDYGANSYLLKPMSLMKFKQTIQTFIEYWLNVVVLPQADNSNLP